MMQISMKNRTDWKWYASLGVILACVGIAAMFMATYLMDFYPAVFGTLLLVSAVTHLIYSYKFKVWDWVLLHLAISVLQGVTGSVLVGFPTAGIPAITLIVSSYLLIGGIFRVVFGLTARLSNTQWVIISGFASSLLGFVAWLQWPFSSVWLLGTAIGIDLTLDGSQWITRALEMKARIPIDDHHEDSPQVAS